MTEELRVVPSSVEPPAGDQAFHTRTGFEGGTSYLHHKDGLAEPVFKSHEDEGDGHTPADFRPTRASNTIWHQISCYGYICAHVDPSQAIAPAQNILVSQ